MREILEGLLKYAPLIAIVLSLIAYGKSCCVDNALRRYECVDELVKYPTNINKYTREYRRSLLAFNYRRLPNELNRLVNSKVKLIELLNEYDNSLDKYDCAAAVNDAMSKTRVIVEESFKTVNEEKISVQPFIDQFNKIGIIDYKASCCE